MSDVSCNAFVSGRWLDSHTEIHADARGLLQTAAERLGLSARGYHRVLKVARTIADLDGSCQIGSPHIGEALRYRPIAQNTEGVTTG
jgi:magnesium chelatase family protein